MASSGDGTLCGACKAPIVGATSHTCMTCDKPVHSWVMATETSYSEVKRNLPAGFTLGKEPSKLDNSLTRWAVDLSPLEGLRLAAREDLRDRHTRHTEAVQKVQLPHPVGGQLKGARIAYGGQLCTR